jgi:uncharacterized membrane protein
MHSHPAEDVLPCLHALSKIQLVDRGGTNVTERVIKSIIVGQDAGQVFKLWADFENFPEFMKNIKSVKKTGDRTSHWVMEGPMGTTIEWDAQTTQFDENQRIGWSSTGGDIKTSGQVIFAPLPQGQTEVTVTLQYIPSDSLAGGVATALFANPEQQLEEDLRNFKRYAEGMSDRLSKW